MQVDKKIKVLIIDDSSIFRRVISKYLQEDPQIEVIATAKDSYEARDKIIQMKPDVLTLDIEMPGMNGIDFLKILMDQYPIPTIVITGTDGRCFEATSAGAVGFVEKPTAKTMNYFAKDLADKIKEASVSKPTKIKNYKINISKRDNYINNSYLDNVGDIKTSSKNIIAIGASMGGVEAISKLLKQIPLGMPPIVITQHMPPIFTKRYAERLNKECRLNVLEGRDGQQILSGHVYIAPGGFQMGVIKKNNKYILEIKDENKISGHCPSVDYLFQSVANVAKENAIGIILTGMGSDGAKGLLDIRKSGGYTVGQDKHSCVVYGMPMVAKNIGAVIKETSLEMIPSTILNQLKRSNTITSNI